MMGDVLQPIPLFESLAKDARDFITSRLRSEHFAPGETIVRQGDTGDSLYIIVSGLVKVTKREKDGTSHELARLQNGDYFGEMSLLAGQPRSADITAITETSTLKLSKPELDGMLLEYPTIAVHFSRVLSKRLRDVSQFTMRSKQSVSIVSLYSRHIEPLFQSIISLNLAASFTRELMKQVLLIEMNNADEEVARILQLDDEQAALRKNIIRYDILGGDDVSPCIIKHKTGFHILPLSTATKMQPRLFEKAITPLLEKLKHEYDYILINCAKDIKKLVQTALEQSDMILYLTPTSDNAIQRCKKDADMFVQGYGENRLMIGVLRDERQQGVSERHLEELLAPHTFVRLHNNSYVIDRFLRTGRPFVYEHPKTDISRSIQHLTRRIGRVRVGLALGSGSARGFAHVGVLKVLEAHDIPIDMIAGASMGAFVGGFYAAGVSAAELEEMVLSYRSKRKVRKTIFDLTIPWYGISKGNRLAKFMRHRLKDITFDELSIPFVAIATDISNGNEVVLRHGILWQALRASGSVPVLFEPYHLDGRYLIDGGITNPLPTDVLIENNVDIIISCAVNTLRKPIKLHEEKMDEREAVHDDAPITLPLTDRKYGIIDALTRSMGIMSAANTLQKSRLADIDIRPKVSHIDWNDFHRGDELMKAGERAAEEAIPTILELLKEKIM
ncbi:putative esterase of the alpha-beta hydrolase superfamily [Candidatus Moduliflexus flocculans]|uniref:Putative esterase of the alpha-beta hydrolase superfamily n=1 Tax=Candidatus Moduliflexus flocculans TaxID=1499966 RepID=A0A081BN19_9BACT|nr:putative esterase of the alpha-beta hydrolase superfamily [Candidatus Moduliflexus flocculans]